MATRQILSKRYGVTNFVEDMDRLFKNGRATGNTTRQADFLIQLLFENKNKWVPIIDHASLDVSDDKSMMINEYLLNRIKRRLEDEHQINKNSKIQLKQEITNRLEVYLEHDDYYEILLSIFRSTDRKIYLLKLTSRE